MDLPAAYEVLGLTKDATPADIHRTYRVLRKPLLKELNQFEADAEPPELVEQLNRLDTAFKFLSKATGGTTKGALKSPTGTGDTSGTAGRSTGRIAFAPGAVLLDRYEIKSQLSHRPEGDTYLVHDRVRGADVGLKVVDEGLIRDPGQRVRVKRGVLEAARLNHAGLVRILDVVRLEHTYAVVQQLPIGENLWERLHGEQTEKRPLAPELLLTIAEQCTHALAHLHRTTPHATLRPESIWIGDDGGVQISDFGFAEVRAPLRARRLSRSKLGTAYWAPEQYRDDVNSSEERSDQHSLALILYEAMSGKPTVGQTAAIRTFRQDLPRRFTQAIERALATKPSHRFESLDGFGHAAFPGYEPEGAPPSAETSRTLLVPALGLVALFAAFVFSPLGSAATSFISDAATRWHVAEARDASADRDWRQLRALSGRLHERRGDLDEASREELSSIRTALAEDVAEATGRTGLQDRLAQIMRQLVATSRRDAETAFERSTKALDALAGHAPRQPESSDTTLAAQVRKLGAQREGERLAHAVVLVQHQAAVSRRDERELAEVRAAAEKAELAAGYRALLEAGAALAIGDETATGTAYGAAATTLNRGAATIESVVQSLQERLPIDGVPATPLPLETAQLGSCLQALFGDAAPLSDDKETARVLAGLRADAAADAEGRWLVDPLGSWALQVHVGRRTILLGGTWRVVGDAFRLRASVVDDRLLETPYEVHARRGDDRPGVADLVAALAAAPHGVRALWSTRRGDAKALATPKFIESERIVRAGNQSVRGSVPPKTKGCVLVEGRRFETAEEAFESRVQIPGDVLGTWLRAHVAAGLRSGPGCWMRVRTDGMRPRVHLLEPAADSEVDADATVIVRALVYDSNLTALEIGGEAQSLRRDDVYVLVERTLRAPATGTLTLPVRAVDAAGNETLAEWTWRVR